MREMRNSGVKWLGSVPSHWNVVKTKYLLRKHKNIAGGNSPNYQRLALTMKGVIQRSKYADSGLQPENFDGYQILHQGDFVFKLIDLQNISTSRVGLSSYEGLVSPAYIVATPTGLIEPAYLEMYYLMMWRNEVFNALGAGVRQSLGFQELGDVPVLVPPRKEQLSIADFLDAKCAEIDRAIEAAEKSIEELLKYRSSYLDDTFSRLDSIYPKVKLKYVLKESKEKSADGIGEPLSITIASGVLRSSELEIPNPASSMVGAKIVHAGDLVFNKLKAYFGVMYVSPYDGLISSEYAIYRALNPSEVSLKYIEYLVHTNRIIDEFIIRISGVADGFRRLYTSELFNIAITLPPLLVQEKAVRELNAIYDSIDASIASKQTIIADLKAYKRSLVYEVVTGKREV